MNTPRNIVRQAYSDQVVAEYLSSHRTLPPEKYGWFTAKEIWDGIRGEYGSKNLYFLHIGRSLQALQQTEPPVIEATSLKSDTVEPLIPAQQSMEIKESAVAYRALIAVEIDR